MSGDAHAGDSHGGGHGIKRYVISYGLLVVFTVLTYVLRGFDFGSMSLTVAMMIATAKATVVVLFFMHLWDHPGANRMVFVVSLFFVFLLIAIVLLDFDTRFPLSLPPGSTLNP